MAKVLHRNPKAENKFILENLEKVFPENVCDLLRENWDNDEFVKRMCDIYNVSFEIDVRLGRVMLLKNNIPKVYKRMRIS